MQHNKQKTKQLFLTPIIKWLIAPIQTFLSFRNTKFLQYYFKGKYVVENVISWYDPLIHPQTISRHYYWANFPIRKIDVQHGKLNLTGGWEKQDDKENVKHLEKEFNFDLSKYNVGTAKKRRMLRNCVGMGTGLHILNEALGVKVEKAQQELLI